MNRHRALALSPATAKQLVEAFAHTLPSSPSDSPESPESSYSPTFSPPMLSEQPFEFSTPAHEQYSQYDEAEYESLMADEAGWDAPAWGRWPESNGSMPGWSNGITRSPSTGAGSIISLSPRGSGSMPSGGRKTSATLGKAWVSGADGRRDSDPSLLGFDLASRAGSLNQQRRRSSVRSNGTGSLRRSSVISTVSLDPSEDARLRSFASMDQLGRRFSEVVEVTVTAGSDDDDEVDHRHMDLGSAMQQHASQWSPWTASSYDDESVLHTGSIFPTPEVPVQQLSMAPPVVLSQHYYRDADTLHPFGTPSPSDISAPPSPYAVQRPPLSRSHSSTTVTASTPPPPVEPAEVVRARLRPSNLRSSTTYQFPARSAGVPPGASAPRPAFVRSTSGPIIPVAAPASEATLAMEKRAQGTFPLSRPLAIGVSPLRASTRRESIVSNGSSRRGSLATSEGARRASAHDQFTAAQQRRSSKDAVSRRISEDLRRASLTGSTRKGSASGSVLPADRRRSSVASRKSSIVSIGEYAYLGPEIVIDAPATPALQSIPAVTATPAPSPTAPSRFRAAPPPAIVLPTYSFPALSPSLTTPRFNPLDSFFGRDQGPLTPLAPTALEPTSPFASALSDSETQKTPVLSSPPPPPPHSVMDRPRPVTSTEYRDYSIPLAAARAANTGSPKSPRSPPGQAGSRAVLSPNLHVDLKASPVPSFASEITSNGSSTTGDEAVAVAASSSSSLSGTAPKVAAAPSVQRKAVPRMSLLELRAAYSADLQLREQRETAERAANLQRAQSDAWLSHADQVILRAAAGHRRAISVEQGPSQPRHSSSSRPTSGRRQTTEPIQPLNRSSSDKRSSHIVSPMSSPLQRPPQPPAPVAVKEKTIVKRASVTFAEPARPSMGRTTSFSRFFQSSKSKQQAAPHTAIQHSQYAPPPARPISLDAGLRAVTDQTFFEAQAALRRL